jgi:hypothetical protein
MQFDPEKQALGSIDGAMFNALQKLAGLKKKTTL